jgi:hypothetical protein
MSENPDAIGADIEATRERLSDAPRQAAAKTQGNPLAAALIAFGAGLLVSSLVPAGQKEREAADALKTAAEPVTAQLSEAAKDMAEGLKEPAREAVKATAADAAENVKGEGRTAVSEVKDTAADAKDQIRNT